LEFTGNNQKTMKKERLQFGFLIVCFSIFSVFVFSPCGVSQEANSPAAVADSLETLKSKWTEIENQLIEKENLFRASTDAQQQDALRSEYRDLLDRANELIGQLKDAAVVDFRADQANEAAIKTLIGIMMNDADFGRDDNVMRLSEELIEAGIDEKYFTTAASAERLPVSAKEVFEELLIRLAESKDDTLPRVKIHTSKGDIVVELFEDQAPNTVANFISLVESKFYDGLKFHRVIEGFMAQGGDPKGDGSGGPDYHIKCECESPEARRHFVGSLSMAHAGKDTGGSQFFLTFRRTMELDGKHTVFGRVIEGLDVLDRITRTYDAATNTPLPNVEADRIESMEVVRKRDHEYKPVKVGESAETDSPELQPPSTTDNSDAGEKVENKKAPSDEPGVRDPAPHSDTKPEEPGKSPANESGSNDEGSNDAGGDDGGGKGSRG